jgi:chemotaxis regulatin CheY-phosphate phosphatase CheZ
MQSTVTSTKHLAENEDVSLVDVISSIREAEAQLQSWDWVVDFTDATGEVYHLTGDNWRAEAVPKEVQREALGYRNRTHSDLKEIGVLSRALQTQIRHNQFEDALGTAADIANVERRLGNDTIWKKPHKMIQKYIENHRMASRTSSRIASRYLMARLARVGG